MKSLVVSLHDVSPLSQEACDKILRELHALGVRQTSLLVVPDHHHRAPFLHRPEFCSWLEAQHAKGHEMVIHGYFHQRARRGGETARAKFFTRFYTADEGEFYDISEPDAHELVRKARYEFAQLGLHPVGFIAPAWLLSSAAENALRALQLAYTTRLGTVNDLKNGRVHHSQSLVWSVRSGWRRAMSVRWNAALHQRLRANPLLRLSIHPPDFSHAKIREQIRALISRALADRKAITYHDWVAGTRDSSS